MGVVSITYIPIFYNLGAQSCLWNFKFLALIHTNACVIDYPGKGHLWGHVTFFKFWEISHNISGNGAR